MKNKKFLIGFCSLSASLGLCSCGAGFTFDENMLNPESETHQHSFTKKVTTDDYLASEATCLDPNKYYYSCSCGEKGGETFSSGDCLPHSFSNYRNYTEATCTENATSYVTCINCGVWNVTEEPGTAKGHSFANYSLLTPASCIDDASYISYCQNCDACDVITDYGSKIGHDYIEMPEQAVAATCSEDEIRVQICRVCNNIKRESIPGTAKGHSLTSDSINVPATCENEGYIYGTCNRCGRFINELVPATGHSFIQVGEPIAYDGLATVFKEVCPFDNVTRYRIAGNDVTQASKANSGYITYLNDGPYFEPNCVIDDVNKAVMFWGRPINNKMDLGVTSDNVAFSTRYSTLNDDDCKVLYDADVYGSFFEYKFLVGPGGVQGNLVAEMGAPQFYNGSAFSSEWTGDWYPGIKNEEGECYVERFVVELDGIPLKYDFSIDNSNVVQEEPWHLAYSYEDHKSWYTFPFAEQLDLAEGIHTIRFRMGAGNTFKIYNICIQDVPEPIPNPFHAHDWVKYDTVSSEGKSTYRIDKCNCGKERIVISANQDLNGYLDASFGKLKRGTSNSYDGTAITKYAFNVSKPFKGELKAKVNVDSAFLCSKDNNYSYYSGKNGSSSILPILPNGKSNTVMTVNNVSVAMPNKKYFEMGITGTTEADCGIADYGEFDFSKGYNEFTLAALDSCGLQYFEFYIEYDGFLDAI